MFLKISLCALLIFSNCTGMGMIRRTVSKMTDTVKRIVAKPNPYPLDVNEDYNVELFSLPSIYDVAYETWQTCKTQGQRLGSAISWISSNLTHVYWEYRLNRIEAELAAIREKNKNGGVGEFSPFYPH